MSAFSPYTDSPNSPAPFSPLPASNRSSGPSDWLAPPPSPYPQNLEPSPVDSNGTEGTEIEDDAQEGTEQKDADDVKSPDIEITSPSSQEGLAKLDTSVFTRDRSNSDGTPASVIHAPPGFKQFDEDSARPGITSSPSRNSERTVRSPSTPDAAEIPNGRPSSVTSPLNTDLPLAEGYDRATPRAQTRQEAEEDWKRRSRRTPSLEDIPELQDADKRDNHRPDTVDVDGENSMSQTMEAFGRTEQDVSALKTALSECWTLCNTLARLSSIHRERMFGSDGRGEIQEQAWRSCWRLCQQLYNSRDEYHTSHVRPTLELCRDFCQALFEARSRSDEASDSVLRVSFELNNHLYNTHDRHLPDVFRERTLDFYVTLCHRLMRLRTSLPQETDALLHACWSLAEMLFNLRQNNREAKPADEELLGSAVQACWELCDLFREGWTQIRPERSTPRPSQNTFSSNTSLQSLGQMSRSDGRSSSLDASS
ncbi:hypothetical protein LTR66_013613, partial [Elasticomyces elasticus]